MTTDLQSVVSSWRIRAKGESGFGQDAVDEPGLVLDLAQASADGGDR